MEEKILKIENLFFKYFNDEKWILENINFELYKGDFVLISGPSGGGKSTFVKCCNGIIPNMERGIQKGKIEIYSKDINNYKSGEISKNIGTVFQNADEQIIFDKVKDELIFPCENLHYNKNDIKENIEEKSKFMDLDLEKNTNILSGGQKQRLVTASTLVMNQKIIVFDEPLANLDYKGSVKLLKKLKYLCKEKKYSIIFIEHRLDLVSPYCNRFIWLEDSKMKEFENREKFDIFLNNNVDNKIISKKIKNGFNNSKKENIISLENISYTKNNKEILKNINLNIYKNSKYLIIGDNGSGKTTLVGIITRLLKETNGKYLQKLVKNKDIKKKNWFKKIGYVFQNPNYQLYMSTVYDEINSSSTSLENTDKIIELFDLENIKNRHPHSLSEGQKRKIGIASILAMEPEVLVLDEPTVGQDYKSLKMLYNALETLGFLDKTIITITHDIRIYNIFEENIILVDNGEIKEIGDNNLIQKYMN